MNPDLIWDIELKLKIILLNLIFEKKFTSNLTGFQNSASDEFYRIIRVKKNVSRVFAVIFRRKTISDIAVFWWVLCFNKYLRNVSFQGISEFLDQNKSWKFGI